MNCTITSKKDIKKLAICHCKAFPESLSSKLHISFAEKMFMWYVDDPRGVLFHIEKDGEVLGYCGAIKTHRQGLEGSSTSIAQYSFKAMLKALLMKPWLIFHKENINRIPLITKNILLKLGLSKKKRYTKAITDDSFLPFWGIVSIGVAPPYQGKGIGRLLLDEFERLAKEDGVVQVYLSVKATNFQAIKSYQRNHWQEKTRTKDSITLYKKL